MFPTGTANRHQCGYSFNNAVSIRILQPVQSHAFGTITDSEDLTPQRQQSLGILDFVAEDADCVMRAVVITVGEQQ